MTRRKSPGCRLLPRAPAPQPRNKRHAGLSKRASWRVNNRGVLRADQPEERQRIPSQIPETPNGPWARGDWLGRRPPLARLAASGRGLGNIVGKSPCPLRMAAPVSQSGAPASRTFSAPAHRKRCRKTRAQRESSNLQPPSSRDEPKPGHAPNDRPRFPRLVSEGSTEYWMFGA